ncbi:hypothetical protein A9Q86_03490 [Flavobacteriales bacterium 33_180_T64]|nr:hypothetical protein A9Q86_03490 [Flavobacteriales bacterium 33_180_T64]
MKDTDKKLAQDLVKEITTSNMTIQKKLLVLELLDKAFRKHFGIIYLSNHELEDNDILFRSM